jgi:uncharacterized coiled-coil DUF342 family protein
MTRTRKLVTTKSDKRTQEYILGLMQSLPVELFELVKELRGITETIRNKADVLDQDVQQVTEDLRKFSTRLDALENVVRELCDTASKAVAIEPLYKLLHPEEETK